MFFENEYKYIVMTFLYIQRYLFTNNKNLSKEYSEENDRNIEYFEKMILMSNSKRLIKGLENDAKTLYKELFKKLFSKDDKIEYILNWLPFMKELYITAILKSIITYRYMEEKYDFTSKVIFILFPLHFIVDKIKKIFR